MKRYKVRLRPSAERDLEAIFDWIAAAESVAVVRPYLARLRAFLAGFDLLPERGTRLRDGRRRIGFERRCTILFRVREHDVLIQRVFGGGRETPRK